MSLKKAYEQYRDRAEFVIVYIREAHPADSPRAMGSMSKVNEPQSSEERLAVARRCAKELDFGIPFSVDDMQDSAAKAYAAHPDRLFIVGQDGKIAYQGGRGPFGFKVEEMAARLEELL